MDYNILNWSSTYTTNLECIRISIKKAVRIISFKQRQEHAAPLCKNLEILPLDQLILLKKGSFMWKLSHNLVPTQLASYFTLNDPNSTLIAQRLISGNYQLPIPRLDYAKRHITYSGVQLWNSGIPNDLKATKSLRLFNKRYKTWLLNSVY